MYIAPRQGQTTPWGQMLRTTERPFLFAHMLQVSKRSKSDFIHIFNAFMYVYSPGVWADNPLGTNF